MEGIIKKREKKPTWETILVKMEVDEVLKFDISLENTITSTATRAKKKEKYRGYNWTLDEKNYDKKYFLYKRTS